MSASGPGSSGQYMCVLVRNVDSHIINAVKHCVPGNADLFMHCSNVLIAFHFNLISKAKAATTPIHMLRQRQMVATIRKRKRFFV